MTYREMAVEIAKIAGRELTENAEKLIPRAENVKEIDIWIRIPSLSDSIDCIPEIEVDANLYPDKAAIRKYLNIADAMNRQEETK